MLTLPSTLALGALVARQAAATVRRERDVTARLSATLVTLEQHLAAQRGELTNERALAQQLMDATPAITLVLSTEGTIENVNPAFKTLTGYRLDEVRGRDGSRRSCPNVNGPGCDSCSSGHAAARRHTAT
jgi:PAS domain-containing protein